MDKAKKQKFDKGYLITSEPAESFLYKLLRFLIKGTFSQKLGPAAGIHYYKAEQIDAIIRKMGFVMVKSKKIPFYFPFDLFHLNLYQKSINRSRHLLFKDEIFA